MNIIGRIATDWVRLTLDGTDTGRYLGSFDPARGILVLQHRGKQQVFDLVEIVRERLQQSEKCDTIEGER